MSSTSKPLLTVRDIATAGLMAAMLEAVKLALSAIPNVELVTLLIILFTLYLGKKTLIAVWAFVGIECLVWGLGLWTVMYVYIWPLLVLLTLLIRKFCDSKWMYVILAAGFGLTFGAMCALVYIPISGITYAITWWISGIPYDLLHGLANGITAAILFGPLSGILKKIKNGIH